MSDKDKPGQENAEDRFFVKTVAGGKVTDSAKQVCLELLVWYDDECVHLAAASGELVFLACNSCVVLFPFLSAR